MKKRLLPLALALAMCLSLLPAPALAAGATITEIVSPDTYDSFTTDTSSIKGFYEGITWRGTSGASGCGAFDTNGAVIIPPHSYAVESDPDVTKFSDGVAWARGEGSWHAVDKTGRELFILEKNLWPEDGKSDFRDGLAMVYDRETQTDGFVDKTGRLVIPCESKNVGSFHDGPAKVHDAANAYDGYMDVSGKVVVPYQYADAKDFVNGFGAVRLGARWTIIDTTGKELLPQTYSYDASHWPNDISPEAIRAQGDDGYAFINKSGQVVSGGYKRAESFVNGMAKVQKDGKYGYVNQAGVLVVPCQYTSADDFCDGYAVVKAGGDSSYSIIDKSGKVTGTISADKYDSIHGPDYESVNAGNGCFWISSDASGTRRYGFIDYAGREIVPCKYALVGADPLWDSVGRGLFFYGGVAPVKNFDNKWGFVNVAGQEVVPCTLTDVRYTNEPGIFVVKNFNGDDRYSVVKSSGWTEPTVASNPGASAAGKFADVKTSDYFAEPVQWAVEKGITTGTSATSFSPNQNCTAAQILTFLWRASGSPEPAAANPFSDVKTSDFYYKAALWAAEKGIVSGGTFGGNAPCTRSMAATYMWKAAGSPSAGAASFTDVSAGADYAGAVAWAVEKGVTTGTSAATFSPDSVCTRGQIVTFLYRDLAK